MNFEELKAYYKSQGFGDEEAALKAKYDLNLSQEDYNRYQHPTRYNIGSALKAGADGAGMGATFVNPVIGGLYFLGTGAHLISNGQTAEGVTRGAMASIPGAHLAISGVSRTMGNMFSAGMSGLLGGTAISDMLSNGVNMDNSILLGFSMLPYMSKVLFPLFTIGLSTTRGAAIPKVRDSLVSEKLSNWQDFDDILSKAGYDIKPKEVLDFEGSLESRWPTFNWRGIVEQTKPVNEREPINKRLSLYLAYIKKGKIKVPPKVTEGRPYTNPNLFNNLTNNSMRSHEKNHIWYYNDLIDGKPRNQVADDHFMTDVLGVNDKDLAIKIIDETLKDSIDGRIIKYLFHSDGEGTLSVSEIAARLGGQIKSLLGVKNNADLNSENFNGEIVRAALIKHAHQVGDNNMSDLVKCLDKLEEVIPDVWDRTAKWAIPFSSIVYAGSTLTTEKDNLYETNK